MKLEAGKKNVKKASKMPNPIEQLKCLPAKIETRDGEPLSLEFYWATHLNDAQHLWIFELFCQNMKEMYTRSNWGFEENSKKHELQATTARYIIVKNSKKKHIGYTHYRFDMDNDVPVVYCYELQVDKSYQNKGIGSLLLQILENLAKNSGMEKVMATVFAFNAPSLGFFHRNGFSTDLTCPDPEDDCDYLILSKPVTK
uniref:N-alpha-acetyltransferase 40 n=1 Tax=Acrobeloides nanus TaxID=290746 RepID=A0A914DE69_9BILA